jgi:hypothetical protein
MIPFNDVNIVSVLIASVAQMIVGMIWYSPSVFGKAWMHEIGFAENDCKNCDMKKAMGTGFLGTLVGTYFVMIALLLLGPRDLNEGFMIAFVLWAAVAVPIGLSGVAWEQRTLKLFAINAAYTLVGLLVAVAVLMQSVLS